MAGTNGVRKLRFSAAGSNVGKSGAFRVFYINLVEHDVVILTSVLAKTEQDNLSRAQRNALAGLVAQLRAEFENRRRP